MAQDVLHKISYQTFPGAQTNTIAMDATHSALIDWIDIYTAAAVVMDLKVGATQVGKGTIATENSPVQLRFGKGRGSGVAGDDITIQMDGACETFIGYTEYRVLP
jgi:hypothetical protein